jgi:hypothetical protein
MAQSFDDEDTAPLPPSPTWLMPPPNAPRASLRTRATSRIEELLARTAGFRASKMEVRLIDVGFALAASAAFGAISVLMLLEIAG